MGIFRAVVLAHKEASLEIREKIALSNPETLALIDKLKNFTSLTDILVLSTCNRTEVYYNAEEDHTAEIVKLLAIQKGFSSNADFLSHFRSITDSLETVRYLFRVAMGLEAKVIGDLQISNQIKNAYQIAADTLSAGPFLHRLMHTIFFCNKRVAQETEFRDGAASVSYATAEFIEDFATHFVEAKVLILGLGEMGADVCRNLMGRGIVNVNIANRTEEKAIAIASECGFRNIDFYAGLNSLHEYDIIVSSVRVEKPVITTESFNLKKEASYKFVIDMAVPRSVATEVEDIPGIEVYNIDSIQSLTQETVQKRLAAIPAVEAIIEENVVDFESWSQEMEVSPTIKKLKIALEEIRQEEINRYIKKLSDNENQAVDKITKGIMQKILKLPVLHLKAACKRGEAETLIDVLNDLFNLEKVEEPKH